MGSLDDLKDAGFSDDEINGYAKDTRQTLATGGFNDQEINDYLGTAQPDNLAANKTLARTVVNAAVDNYREQAPPDQQGLSLGKLQAGFSQANKAILDTAKEVHDQITDPANIYGAAEAWLNMATGMVTGFPASLFGAVGGLYAKHSVGMDVDPAEMADTFAKAFTYAPRSARGQQLAGIAQYPLQKLARGASWAGHRTTDLSMGAGLSDETSAGIGATVEQVLQFAPLMLMGELFHKAGGQVILNEDFKNVSRVVAGDGATTETRQAVENSLREIHDKTGIGPYTVAGEAAKDPEVHADLINPEVGVPKAFERFVEKPQVTDAAPGDGAPLPEVAQQVNESLQTQGTVRIPVADYLTHLAGGKVDEGFRENLKADPAGMTKAESDAYFQNHTNQIMDEAKTLSETKKDDDAWQQSKQAIHDDMLRQMEEAAIHGTDVNKQYAKVRSEIFSVGAHRTGTTPEEFYQKWGSKIVAGDIAQAKGAAYDKSSALNQGEENDFDFTKRTDGTSGSDQTARTGTQLPGAASPERIAVHRAESRRLQAEDFKRESLGYTSGAAPSGRGVHFYEDRAQAESHAEKNGLDVNSYYVTLKKPRKLTLDDLDKFSEKDWSADDYYKWREMLRQGGYDGITIDQSAAGGKRVVIAFDPNQVAKVPEAKGELDFPKTFKSSKDSEVRGYFDPIKRLIGLTKNANLSTLPHELGHEVFDIYTKIAKDPDCPPEIRADVDKLLDYVGVKGDGDKTALEVWHSMTLEEQRPSHEKIAEAFEKYFWEGKAPTPELQPVFARIKGWIADIYRHSIKNLPNLNPEVRGVFDRMLASEDAGVEKIQADSPEEVDAEAGEKMGAVENAAQPAETKSGEARAESANKISNPSAEDNDIQARFAEKLKDHESAVAEYSRIKNTWGGKFLNADLVRELCPDYLKNRFKASVIHQLASAFIRRLYAEKLATIKEPTVLFTAGGPGSGKSTVLEGHAGMAKMVAKADIVYDTTMSHYESSKEMIDQALDAGGIVHVSMVIRDPVDALVNGALHRAALEEKEFGSARTMPVDYFVNSHLGAMKTVLRLAEDYKDYPDVTFNFIDNTHGTGNSKELSFEDAKKIVFQDVEARVKEALEKEFKNGRVSEKIYKSFKFGEDVPGKARKSVSLPAKHRQNTGGQLEP